MRSMRILATVLVVLFLTGCGYKKIQYNYSILENPEEAKKIVHQVILEQPRGTAPTAVDISDDYLQITVSATRKNVMAGGITTVPIVDTLFYNNIKSTELYAGRNFYSVLVKENSGNIKLRVITREEKKGKLFIDALKTLEQNFYAHNPKK
jgi:hypothetical protein